MQTQALSLPLLALVLLVLVAMIGREAIVAAGLLCLFSALVIGSVSSRRNAGRVRRWKNIGSHFESTAEAFERHVSETWQMLGYSVALTRRIGDQGVDIIATRNRERIAIQCKRLSEKVSNSAVQEVHAGRAHYKCNRALVVCLGGFTRPAMELARTTGVDLMTGAEYADLVDRLQPEAAKKASFSLPNGKALLYSCALVAAGLLGLSIGVAFHG